MFHTGIRLQCADYFPSFPSTNIAIVAYLNNARKPASLSNVISFNLRKIILQSQNIFLIKSLQETLFKSKNLKCLINVLISIFFPVSAFHYMALLI